MRTDLDEVVQDSFAGHVTVDSVVSIHEVRSEMMQQRIQVQQVVAALFTAVNTLTALKHTHTHTHRGFTVAAQCWHED